MTIEEKCHIEYVRGHRCYRVPLFDCPYSSRAALPRVLEGPSFRIEANNWSDLLVNLLNALNSYSPKERSFFLKIAPVERHGNPPFSDKDSENRVAWNGLFVDVDNKRGLIVENIVNILKSFGLDSRNFSLLLHLYQQYEPAEAIEYYRAKTIGEILTYLTVANYSRDAVNRILNRLFLVERLVDSRSANYKGNIFLFDSYPEFLRFYGRLKSSLEWRCANNPTTLSEARKGLAYLNRYYRSRSYLLAYEEQPLSRSLIDNLRKYIAAQIDSSPTHTISLESILVEMKKRCDSISSCWALESTTSLVETIRLVFPREFKSDGTSVLRKGA